MTEQSQHLFRFLITGASQVHLSFSFRVCHSTVGKVLRETSQVLWDCLRPTVLPVPTVAVWEKIALDFCSIWQLPNCVGALDGKHVRIKAPANSGSEFFNYKGYFSIVLLAVCDAHYRFILVDIGNSGRHSDGGVFSHSRFGKALIAHKLQLPPPKALPLSSTVIPMFFAADEAFPLRVGILRPYPGRNLDASSKVFNYRLSRGRRVVENAFGILAARFQIFFKPINCDNDLAVKIVQASVVLHNFLQDHHLPTHIFGDHIGANGTMVDGSWRSSVPQSINLHSLRNSSSNFHGKSPGDIRDKLREYFLTSQGVAVWHWNYA